MNLESFVARLNGVRRSGNGWLARCPAHDDKNPSLSVGVKGNRILLKCFANCSVRTILQTLGLTMADLFLDSGSHGLKRIRTRTLTVDDLAFDKKLPGEFLRNVGLESTAEGVLIRYRLIDGSCAPRDRIRTDVIAKRGSRWDTREGAIVPYGLWKLQEARDAGFLVIPEGESDCWTLWYHLFPALGIPGSQMVGCLLKEYLANIPRLFIVREPGAGGSAFIAGVAKKLAEIGWMGQASVVSIDGAKDPNDLHRSSAAEFKSRFQGAMDAAQPLRTEMAAGFTMTLLRDLLNEPDEKTAYLVDGTLPSGGLSALVSKPKVGKSTLARELALRVARGQPFLGRETAKGLVVYLALEEKRSEVRNHFRAMGATGREEIYVHTAHAPGEALLALQEIVREKKPVLIIIDPLQKLMRVKDGNDYSEVTLALEPFLVMARQSGAHLLVVHHLGKRDRSDPADGILGSTAIFAGVDTAVILKKSERHRTIQSVQRYGADLAETVLDFDSETKTVSLGDEKDNAEEKRVGDLIFNFLSESAEPCPENVVIEAVEGRTKLKRAALRMLVADRTVFRSGSGKKGDPYLYAIQNACSRHKTGTKEQESEKPDQAPENTSEILVPAQSSDLRGDPNNREREFDIEI